MCAWLARAALRNALFVVARISPRGARVQRRFAPLVVAPIRFARASFAHAFAAREASVPQALVWGLYAWPRALRRLNDFGLARFFFAGKAVVTGRALVSRRPFAISIRNSLNCAPHESWYIFLAIYAKFNGREKVEKRATDTTLKKTLHL